MKRTAILVAGVAAIVSGCAVKTVEVDVPFDAAAAKAAIGPGPNIVEGQAFMRQQGGGVVTCAGEEVFLIPATAYARARMTAIYGSPEGGTVTAFSGGRVKEDEKLAEYEAYTRRSTCDAEGDFSFAGVKDGEFYVHTRVIWRVGDSIFPEGGALAKRVAVSGGETARVLLN